MADASDIIISTTQVLIIDDRAVMRDTFRDVLELSGCRVAEAASLEDGLAVLDTHPVDVVVFADAPGSQAVTAIRDSGHAPRVISVCGKCLVPRSCGADICLIGQFSAGELARAVAG